jgi:UDP:flavonoid glycosyltransferase YjiC (YdhE family)
VLASFAATTLGEVLKIPVIPAYLQHVHPTGHYPFALMRPRDWWTGWFNRFTHSIAAQVFWFFTRPFVNRWRTRELGLDPYPLTSPFLDLLRQRPCCLYGFSHHVVPKPPEWGANVYLTGYWFLDAPQTWRPPDDLLDFLAAGPPPVYVGFGSMADREPAVLADIALDALRRADRRGVLLTGWGGLSSRDLPDTVFKLDHAPHDWLFPRMAAVVHHGGCGTTAAGLRAGVPTVVVPFFADQPFWGWRVARLGVGPAPIPRAELSAERLAAAIARATGEPGLRARAAALGERIRAEDGVACAAAAIERHIASQ